MQLTLEQVDRIRARAIDGFPPTTRETLALAETARLALAADYHVFSCVAAGWQIQHPLACRPRMLDCPVHQAAMALTDPPVDEGDWRVDLDPAGELRFSPLPKGAPC